MANKAITQHVKVRRWAVCGGEEGTSVAFGGACASGAHVQVSRMLVRALQRSRRRTLATQGIEPAAISATRPAASCGEQGGARGLPRLDVGARYPARRYAPATAAAAPHAPPPCALPRQATRLVAGQVERAPDHAAVGGQLQPWRVACWTAGAASARLGKDSPQSGGWSVQAIRAAASRAPVPARPARRLAPRSMLDTSHKSPSPWFTCFGARGGQKRASRRRGCVMPLRAVWSSSCVAWDGAGRPG